jgi:hypothetical protein
MVKKKNEHWHRPVPTRQSEKEVHEINYCR